MKKTILTIALALLSISSFAMTSVDFVKSESSKVLDVVQKNKELKTFKKDLSTSVDIDNLIDFQKISRMTLGKNWRIATDEQKSAFSKEFKDLLINFYGNAMFNFKDAQIDYKNEIVDGDNALVKTVVSYKENGNKKQAKVDYALIKSNESWKMVDVIIEGITLTLSYKDSFGQVVTQKGIDGLISDLREKNNKNKSN